MSQNGPNAPQPQGLELFFAMYAVGLVLGIEQTSQALYNDFQKQWADQLKLSLVYDVGLFVAILLLIVRFFWSTGNIRRALARGGPKSDVHYLVFHLPVLLIQGVLVLFVCFSFVDYTNGKVTAFAVISWFLIATAWNAFWLKFLLGNTRLMPESFWLANNVALVVLSIGLLALAHWGYVTLTVLLAVFVIASVLSSLLDLTKTANSYLSEGGR